jgi:hypothetical protein
MAHASSVRPVNSLPLSRVIAAVAAPRLSAGTGYFIMHDVAGRQVAADANAENQTALEGIECWAGDPEMANSPDSAAQSAIPMHELKWSHAEKLVARRAFDMALGKELEAFIREAKVEPQGSRNRLSCGLWKAG